MNEADHADTELQFMPVLCTFMRLDYVSDNRHSNNLLGVIVLLSLNNVPKPSISSSDDAANLTQKGSTRDVEPSVGVVPGVVEGVMPGEGLYEAVYALVMTSFIWSTGSYGAVHACVMTNFLRLSLVSEAVHALIMTCFT